MTSVQQRQKFLGLIGKACADGARLQPACRQIGLSCRSVQRWQRMDTVDGDQRPSGKRRYVCPPNKLREEERQVVMATLNSEAFEDLPPSQIVPRLADAGVYVASESTMYRLLRQDGQLTHRRSERAAQKRSRPRALAATGPDQVFCWDITYLPTQVRAASTSTCTCSRTCSAARLSAGKCLTARVPSWRASCCGTSVRAKASARASSRCIRTMAHP